MSGWAGWFLEPSLRACLLGGAVGLILAAARVRPGRTRHAVWTAVAIAMLFMPLLPRWVPEVPLAIPVEWPAEIAPVPFGPAEVPAAPVLQSASTPAPVETGVAWPDLVLVLYLAGAAGLLTRTGFGWWVSRRVVASQIPGLPAYESPMVATAMTIGIVRPRVILPVDWREWPEVKLRAVLAHELSHVRRRDALWGLIAGLNRCVFWFHPLAWWLERQRAAEAEFACDDLAIDATGDRRRYAGILVEMADAVQRAGGRLSWHGVGVDGAGPVEERIDRILRGERGEMSRVRRAVVTGACAAAVFLAAACTEKWKAPAYAGDFKPEDQRSRESIARRRAGQALWEAAAAMTAEQLAAAEKAVKANPDDLAARSQLIRYYWSKMQKGQLDAAMIAARRPHALWIIEHHPEDQLTFQQLDNDPLGYKQAAQLWKRLAARPDATKEILEKVAAFTSQAEPEYAESVLIRAESFGELGRLYAAMLARPEFEAKARKRIEESKEPRVLAALAEWELRHVSWREWENEKPDHLAAGVAYANRVRQLDPNSASLRTVDHMIRSIREYREMPAEYRNAKTEQQRYDAISRMPHNRRPFYLSSLAVDTYMRGDMTSYYQHDSALAHQQWRQAGVYAKEALGIADDVKGSEDYGTILYRGNIVMGLSAMREGKKRAAARYLVEAAKAPRTNQLANNYPELSFQLPAQLVKAGEREAVIEYLERFAQINDTFRNRLLESAYLLRNGRQPYWVE